MASGYLYRKNILQRIREYLQEGAVVLWGPTGFGKTLLLKEAARSFGFSYAREWKSGAGAYDLQIEPAEIEPGQLLALPRRPLTSGEGLVLIGPESLMFSKVEIAEISRRLGVKKCAQDAWRNLGGWPLLVRRGLENGVCRPEKEPLRGHLETILTSLGSSIEGIFHLLTVPLPELAWRRAGYAEELDFLFRGGWIYVDNKVIRLLPALEGYFRATRGLPDLRLLKPILAVAKSENPEAAFKAFLEYGAVESGKAFEDLAVGLLETGEYKKVIFYWDLLPEGFRTALGAVRAAEAERSRGRLEEALALARWAVAQGGEHLALALNVEGTVLIHMGRYREAAAVLEQGLKEAGEELRYKILAGLGAALIRSGRFRRAIEVLQEAVGLAQAAGDSNLLAKIQHNLGIALHHAGKLRQAIIKYQEALDLKASGSVLARSNSLLSLGEALRLLGDWQEARRVLLEAADLAKKSGEYRAIGYAYLNLGDLYLEAGWLDKAEEAYRYADGVLRSVSDRYGMGLLWLGKAGLARRRGALASAIDALERAELDLRAGGGPLELAQVWIEKSYLDVTRSEYWLSRAEAAAAEAGGEYQRVMARLLRVIRGGLGAGEALEAAAWVLREDVYPLALNPELFSAWLLAARVGREGKVLLEKLAFGYGRYLVRSFGSVRFAAEVEIDMPTTKEGWLLLWLWLRPQEDPIELFLSSKRPRKRLQLAVHHLRSRLGEEWVRSLDAGYQAAPLPGVWWDVAMAKAAIKAAETDVSAELRDFVRRLCRGSLAPGSPLEDERVYFDKVCKQLVEA